MKVMTLKNVMVNNSMVEPNKEVNLDSELAIRLQDIGVVKIIEEPKKEEPRKKRNEDDE